MYYQTHTPSKPLALRGKVSSAATGLPLISTARVDELEQQVASTAFGNYQFATLPEGHYHHTTADIVAGKGTQLNVILLVDPA